MLSFGEGHIVFSSAWLLMSNMQQK